ncbi:MAG: ABC transporter permease [Lachnospiraceae bacterium]|nr:ABC transporter permease [Lachnospiraceae bacterium]
MKKRLIIPITSLLALLAAFGIGALIILANGDSPVQAYGALLRGAFGSPRGIASTLSSATPLIFTGLSVAVAFKAGMANIGAEGQLYMGGMAAAVVALFVPAPSIILIPLSLLAAFVIGGLYGAIPAVLKVKTNTNEVVTTLMLNYIAKSFTSFLVNYPLKAPGSPLGQTNNILDAAKLPILFKGSRFNIGFIVAVLAAVAVAVMYRRSVMGYEMRVQGENKLFASYVGIDVNKRLTQGMFIGGGLAGLGGAVLVMGIQYKFVQGISPGYGFDGLTIALMAAFNAIAVIPIAILFGALRSGGLTMEMNTAVPSELGVVIQAVVILFMAARAPLSKKVSDYLDYRSTRRETGKTPPDPLKKAEEGGAV